MKTLILAAGVMLVTPQMLLSQQQVCPCVPLSYQWIVTSCETWNCAASALVMANGDKYVLAMPTGSDDFKWVVVRRIVAGSATISPDAPFKLDSFDGMAEASSRFDGVSHDLQPMMLSAPDGKFLIITRAAPEKPKQRAVSR